DLSNLSEPISFNTFDKTWGVAFSPDGATLASCTENGNAQLWKVMGGGIWKPSLQGEVGRFINGMAEVLFTERKKFKTPGRMYGVAFSSDGRTVATAGGLGEGGSQPQLPLAPSGLHLWDAR